MTTDDMRLCFDDKTNGLAIAPIMLRCNDV